MSLVYDAEGEPRYFGLYMGFVVQNVDPKKLGRVKARIPGLLEPASDWAWPINIGSASQNGSWDIPKRGAGVYLMFNGGDIDEPRYFRGWFGRNEQPTPVKDASNDDAPNKIKCFESDRHLVVLDGRSGSEQVLIKDKASGNVIRMTDGKIMLGSEKLMNVMNADGVVLGSGIDTLTGVSYGMLGSASSAVLAKK